MKWNLSFFKENARAFRFLLLFICFYLAFNTLYGLYVQHYYPTSDPFTRWVGRQVIACLSVFDPSVQGFTSDYNEFIAVANSDDNMIYVYEGCNGINVLIVYIGFLVAFWGSWRGLLLFTGIGAVTIHVLNLTRIVLLFGVSLYFRDCVYFVHKYFFTGFIYVVVFILWFFWVKKVKHATQAS